MPTRAVKLYKKTAGHNHINPTKDNDSLLHNQLWIDPKEEFMQYVHTGDPVDLTFSVKELKAFLSFCEGCETDIHLHFEKTGEPILMAPKFGLEDGSNSNFDATLLLATMLTSQLHEGAASEPPVVPNNTHARTEERNESPLQQENCRLNASELPSDHTRIWSDLSAAAVKNTSAMEERQAQERTTLNDNEQREIQKISAVQISRGKLAAGNNPRDSNFCLPTENDHVQEPQDMLPNNGQQYLLQVHVCSLAYFKCKFPFMSMSEPTKPKPSHVPKLQQDHECLQLSQAIGHTC
ncbi:uncharacterized protein LOC127095004 [Lathyrus oleraceus]|uniref:uncharacterized protein LOC127095004 n=1 Tax=Pisum sativum TaxID=3888 RepID=UPI0021D180BD|nr:uncharacterized protein LOC127095004 [Pisum sativum]